MSIRAYCLTACVALASLPQLLSAQPRDTAVATQPGFCWRARPLPRCKVFPITEVAFLAPLATSRTALDPVYGYGGYPDFKSGLRWSVGAMRNETLKRAHGIVVTVGRDGGGDLTTAVEWRNRVWLGSTRSSADFGLGYSQKDVFIRHEVQSPTRGDNVMARGFTASGALLPIDLLGVVARGDLLFTPGRTHHGFSVGAQTGSYGSAIVTGAMAVFLAIVIASLAGGDF